MNKLFFCVTSTEVQRRKFLKSTLLIGYAGLDFAHLTTAKASADDFQDLLSQLQTDPDFAKQMQSDAERQIATNSGLQRTPTKARKSKTLISSRARDLIIACEVTNKATYNQLYRSPIWPSGQSGLTIGIGYDIGYVTPNQLKTDWSAYIEKNSITALSQACGIKGSAAATFVKHLAWVKIDYEKALEQFDVEVLPRYVGETEAALPNTCSLNEDMLGALVSLTYNRGPSYNIQKKRYEQMRFIKSHMQGEFFVKIPPEIRGMKWIWETTPNMRGVLLRRDAEATLFELGLKNWISGKCRAS